MGKEIVYCEICGGRILEQEFEKGSAITLRGNNYCHKCMEKAFRPAGSQATPEPPVDDVTAILKDIEESQEPPPPPPPSTPSPSPPAAAPPPALPAYPTPHPQRASRLPPKGSRGGDSGRFASPKVSPRNTALRLPPVRKEKPKFPVTMGVVAGVLVVAAVAGTSIALFSAGDQRGGSSAAGSSTSSASSRDLPASPEANAIERVRRLAKSGAGPREIVEACSEARLVVGSSFESELADIERRAKEKVAAAEKSKNLDSILKDLRELLSSDRQFERYEEAMKWIASARELAAAIADSGSKVDNASREYLLRYEDAAEKHFEEVNLQAEELAKEKKYDAAIEAIESRFPQQFRASSVWNNRLIPRIKLYQQKKADLAARVAASDGLPFVDPPPLGEWVTVFDGKSMDLWHRAARHGDEDGNWKVVDGELVGESSFPDQGSDSGDFLILKYADLTDFEAEVTLRTEGTGGSVGGRMIARNGRLLWTRIGANLSQGVWRVLRMKFQGSSASFTLDGLPMPNPNAGKPADAGRFSFGIRGGGKIFVREVKILRTR